MTHARMWVGAVVVVRLLCILGLSGSLERDMGVAGADSSVKKLKCDKGQTLTEALRKAKPGDTLQVTGTCHERVTITTDRLTLDGGGSAVLDGGVGGPTEFFEGVVTIDGVQGVTLTGFTIQNGPSQGILGVGGAAFVVKDTTIQNNGVGIFLNNNASAEVTDVEVKDSGVIGIAVQNNSTAVFKGNISSTGSGSNGVAVQSGSTLEIRGASVQAIDNGGNGVDIGDSQAIIFGYPESQGSILTAQNNGSDGIFVAAGSLSFFGGAFAGTGNLATISASNNGGSGIAIGLDGAVVSPFGAANIILGNNQRSGLDVGEGDSALIIGGLTVQNNQTGLLADGAGTLTLVSQESNPSSIQNNNGPDVDLRFGTRVTFGGVAIGSITCDATVLSRGSTVCP
jgi:Right handed beta helix region